MEYNKIYKSFMEYINKCRDEISSKEYTIDDAFYLNISKDTLGISEIIKNHRLKMINIKVDHTMRMVEQIIKVNESLGIKIDLALITKIAILYHDIGRMRQATWSNIYTDSIYRTMNSPFNNHGEDGCDIFLNNDFGIDEKYVPVISETIKYHQTVHTQPRLQYRYDTDISKLNVSEIITGKFNLNSAEWEIASLMVQLVADIDKTDILYQQLLDDSNMIRDYVDDKSMNNLDEISKYWCVSKEEIIEYNHIDPNNYQPRRIRIPIKNMDLNRLIVPSYMREMFYNNSWLDLKDLIKDRNWTFVTILWWRLSHFLNQISFNSVLINIEESQLLDQIYEKIPDELKFLFDEAFAYARNELVENRIKENEGNIYLKR